LHRLQEHPAVDDLADKSHADSIKEMHHAARLFAGIILLDGHPNLKTLDAEHAARTLAPKPARKAESSRSYPPSDKRSRDLATAPDPSCQA
jgi:hypothetical protein